MHSEMVITILPAPLLPSLPADGYTIDDIVFFWQGNNSAVTGMEVLELPQFTIIEQKLGTREVDFTTGALGPGLGGSQLSGVWAGSN